MKRMLTLLAIVAFIACCAPVFLTAAHAASSTPVKPKSAHSHKAPMRHDQITLHPHGRPARCQSAYGSGYNRFDYPSPIHNTLMGVQRW
jgi:hypothetical protein